MPRLKNPRQEAVAQLKAQCYLDPENALSDVQIVKKVYGYAQKTAEGHAHEIVDSRGVQSRLAELIPDDAIARKGKRLFEWKDQVLGKDGKVIAKVPNGELQYKVWRDMLKLNGILSDSINVDARSVQYNLPAESASILSSIITNMQALSTKLGLVQSSNINNRSDRSTTDNNDSIPVQSNIDQSSNSPVQSNIGQSTSRSGQ